MILAELVSTLIGIGYTKKMSCITTTSYNEYESIGVFIPESEIINHDWDNEEVNHLSYNQANDCIIVDLVVSEDNNHYEKYMSCLKAIINGISSDSIEQIIEEMIEERAISEQNKENNSISTNESAFFINLEQEKLKRLNEVLKGKANPKDNNGKDKKDKE